VSIAVSKKSTKATLFSTLRTTGFIRIANAVKPMAELFRILISGKRLGKWLRVAVTCASDEKANASTDASEITVFIPILPADLPEIAPFYLHVKLR
jgi:hypothetical protein